MFLFRTGLCTGWLDRLTSDIRCKKCGECDGCKPVEFEDLGRELEKLKIGNIIQVSTMICVFLFLKGQV